ncbi:MAG: hypothetical protein DRJ07_01140 [Bacteroidetes bacterium]|nr:MAG: hypothetical protein DRJ07_01140 [Bacteroidota bacterium]
MNKILEKIIGDKERFDLPHRILNASMFLAFILNLVAAVSNFMLGLHWSAVVVGLSGVVIFLLLYFYSFYTHNYKRAAIFGLGFLIALFIPSIWFTNEGSVGSTQYLIFLVLTGVLTITKGKIRIGLVTILVLVTLALYIFEYYYPELLITYPNRTERFSDLIISFLFMVFGTIFYINIYYSEYHIANKKLIEKNILLEKTHQEITIQKTKIEVQKVELEKKAKDLQDANKTKDRFFTIIAHDLKSPFNALIGFSELIEQAVENQDLEEIGKINKIVLQSSTQTHKLLLNLLEWSKAQTNQIQYKPEKIDIHKIINAQIELFKYQANKKGLQLKDESNHCLVFADMNLLNTVLRNLISNAVKYTKKGEILIKCIRETSNYKISISDTGVGISKENLKKLFDIGENTSTPGTDGERGTGLGLILCKEFVEKNKGEFFVESTVNKGSVFSFSLPLYEDELLN